MTDNYWLYASFHSFVRCLRILYISNF